MPRPAAFGGLEAGGTKFNCVIGRGPGDILARVTIPTTSPEQTVTAVAAFFAEHRAQCDLLGVGIASFGPLDLDPRSPTYGHILETPKAEWRHFDLLGAVVTATGCDNPVLDTDVNAAALAEYVWGATPEVDPLVYVTIGTGIGGGAIVNGQLLHGRLHPEMGHVRIPRDGVPDDYPGCCPLHGGCLEGLASGQAIRLRYGVDPERLPDDHAAWQLVTTYVALAVANIILTLSPRRVILGGGVSQRLLWPHLYDRLDALLNRYPINYGNWADYVMPPRLSHDSGSLGAIALARRASGMVPVTMDADRAQRGRSSRLSRDGSRQSGLVRTARRGV
jgi:fructokinase